jgi:hypothetical protein
MDSHPSSWKTTSPQASGKPQPKLMRLDDPNGPPYKNIGTQRNTTKLSDNNANPFNTPTKYSNT